MINRIASNRCATITKTIGSPNFKNSTKPTIANTKDINREDKLNKALICLGAIGVAAIAGGIYLYNGKKKPQATVKNIQNSIKNSSQNNIPNNIQNNIKNDIKEEILPKLDNSFEKLEQTLNELNIKTIKDVYRNCTNNNFLGSGRHSNVFKFDDEKLTAWAIKVSKDVPDVPENTQICKLADDFEGINVGQAIAHCNNKVKILKRIFGDTHSIPEWSTRGENQISFNNKEARLFLHDIKLIADFPQESFNEYAKKLKLINDKGYKMDCFNPNNLLIDFNTKEIAIIDFYKYAEDANKNTGYDLFAPLLDFRYFEDIYSKLPKGSQEELTVSAKNILEKCLLASDNIGLNSEMSTFTNFIKTIDGRERNQGLYTYCFKTMCRLCRIDVK